MKKTWLSFLFLFLFLYPQIGLSSPQLNSDFLEENTQETFHRHLPQDLPQMRLNQDPQTKGTYDYVVGDVEFDRIHPLRGFEDIGFNPSTCQIVTKEGAGSGTVVKIQDTTSGEKRSEMLTAKHVICAEDGELSFPKAFQGQTVFPDGTGAVLAEHEVDEICFEPNSKRDVALLKARVIKNNMGDNLSKTVAKVRKKEDEDSKDSQPLEEEVSMSHHPLGVYSQRRNVGWTRQDGSHTISSLPGSSGAGIFTLRNFLGWVHSGGGENTFPWKVFYNVTILQALPLHKKIFSINQRNSSVPIFEEELLKFRECYKRPSTSSSKK